MQLLFDFLNNKIDGRKIRYVRSTYGNIITSHDGQPLAKPKNYERENVGNKKKVAGVVNRSGSST